MTQEELLAKIEVFIAEFCEDEKDFCDVCSPWKALRAVVKLHYEHIGGAEQAVYCYECTRHYPCSTIQAIEKELT